MSDCPIPGAVGKLEPEGTGSNGVMILGEAMGKEEVYEGLPFRPYAPAGAVLERAIRRSGFTRQQFVLWNVVPTHPPNDYLVGAPYEADAIAWGREAVIETIRRFKPRIILALGGTALRVSTGLCGRKLGISNLAGYLLEGALEGVPVVACFHPSYIRRGKMSHFGLLMRALKFAVRVAKEGLRPEAPPLLNPPAGYILHPTESQAGDFLTDAKSANRIAYDIENFYSVDEEEAEEHQSNDIRSIQFSLGPGTGIYMPWREPYIGVAKEILSNPVLKMGWNNWRFDDPVLRANGCTINGTNHDLMWAWHALQPDLPRGLQFAVGQLGWPWPWKHLSDASPEFYGIVDVDVLQSIA